MGESRRSPNPFDALAAGYEGWFASRFGRFIVRREEALILDLLNPKAGDVILEVGAGTGWFARAVAQTGVHCVGLEPSAAMLAVAKARPMPDVGYVRGRGELLPFRDDSFDALFYMTTLEFVEDVAAAIGEANRVVRGGGRLVLGVLNADGPWARTRKRHGGLWTNAHFFSKAELETLLSPLGTTRIQHCVHVPPQLGWLPGPLLGFVDQLVRRWFGARGALIGAAVTLRE